MTHLGPAPPKKRRNPGPAPRRAIDRPLFGAVRSHFDGHLANWLLECRKDRWSLARISRTLHQLSGKEVSTETIRAWLRDLEGSV